MTDILEKVTPSNLKPAAPLTKEELKEHIIKKTPIWYLYKPSGDVGRLLYVTYSWLDPPYDYEWLIQADLWAFYLNYWIAWGEGRKIVSSRKIPPQ